MTQEQTSENTSEIEALMERCGFLRLTALNHAEPHWMSRDGGEIDKKTEAVWMLFLNCEVARRDAVPAQAHAVVKARAAELLSAIDVPNAKEFVHAVFVKARQDHFLGRRKIDPAAKASKASAKMNGRHGVAAARSNVIEEHLYTSGLNRSTHYRPSDTRPGKDKKTEALEKLARRCSALGPAEIAVVKGRAMKELDRCKVQNAQGLVDAVFREDSQRKPGAETRASAPPPGAPKAGNGKSNGIPSPGLEQKVVNDNAVPDVVWQPTENDLFSGLPQLSGLVLRSGARYLVLAAQSVEYAWQDIIVVGTIVVLAGAPGSGKTTFIFLYIVARAQRGGPIMLLGREVYPAKPGQRILLIEAEHNEASTARKLLASLRLLGLGDDVLEGDRILTVARRAVTLGSPAWLECVQLIAAGLISDVIVDTVARFAPADANSEGAQVGVYSQIAQAIEQAPEGKQPTCVLVTHTKKGGAAEDIEAVSGSTQRVGQADSVLIADASREGGRVLSTRLTAVKLREDPGERWPAPHTFAIQGGKLVQERAKPVKAPEPKQTAPARKQEKLNADALELGELVRDAPGLGTVALREAAYAKLGWSNHRVDRVKAHLCKGVAGTRLVDTSKLPNVCKWEVEP
jgi:hypothetical protein